METKNYSAIYRIMHWAIAICMSLILITIFLRMNWMNKDHVAEIIRNFMSTTDQSLSQDQLIVLAKQIRKPMWDWHIYIGYVMVGLFSIRLLLPLFGEMKFSNPFGKAFTAKEKFQHGVYLFFSIGVTISLITGMFIEFGPKTLKNQMEDIHILSIYYLVAFLVIHFGGVLIAELTSQQGIISRMVSGSRKSQ
jgi:cytochrome b561